MGPWGQGPPPMAPWMQGPPQQMDVRGAAHPGEATAQAAPADDQNDPTDLPPWL